MGVGFVGGGVGGGKIINFVAEGGGGGGGGGEGVRGRKAGIVRSGQTGTVVSVIFVVEFCESPSDFCVGLIIVFNGLIGGCLAGTFGVLECLHLNTEPSLKSICSRSLSISALVNV